VSLDEVFLVHCCSRWLLFLQSTTQLYVALRYVLPTFHLLMSYRNIASAAFHGVRDAAQHSQDGSNSVRHSRANAERYVADVEVAFCAAARISFADAATTRELSDTSVRSSTSLPPGWSLKELRLRLLRRPAVYGTPARITERLQIAHQNSLAM